MTYSKPRLIELIELWWEMESSKRWATNGHKPCAPIHRQATSSRQWDSTSTVLDDQLERSTAAILGDCLYELTPRQRSLILVTVCGAPGNLWASMLVASIPVSERQQLLDAAMDQLATKLDWRGVQI